MLFFRRGDPEHRLAQPGDPGSVAAFAQPIATATQMWQAHPMVGASSSDNPRPPRCASSDFNGSKNELATDGAQMKNDE
jgi:hypothetical protein